MKIWHLYLYSTLFFHLCANTSEAIKEYRYVIIVPSYNNERWCTWNLNSLKQNHSSYRIVYIDDCSTDTTKKLVKKWLKQNNLHVPFTYIRTNKRCGALANLYRAIHACDDDEIIVCVDGDDALAHPNVLRRLDREYAKGIWLTYGQYRVCPTKKLGNCKQLLTDIPIRQQPFVTSHLRTFYAWLFKEIKLEDLLDKEDKFYTAACDVAHMLPLVELARNNYSYIADVLYKYNHINSLNVCRTNRPKQQYNTQHIRSKKPYNQLIEKPTSMQKDLRLTSNSYSNILQQTKIPILVIGTTTIEHANLISPFNCSINYYVTRWNNVTMQEKISLFIENNYFENVDNVLYKKLTQQNPLVIYCEAKDRNSV